MTKRVIKQTKETLEGSIKAGNNQERTDMLTAQVKMLEELLPQQLAGETAFRAYRRRAVRDRRDHEEGDGARHGELTKRTGGTSTRPLPQRSCRASWPSEVPVSE